MYRTFPIADVKFAFIRHFETHKVKGLVGIDADVQFCMRHARKLDDGQQGLAPEGNRNAFESGRLLQERGVELVRLDHTPFVRNAQGAEARRQGYVSAGGKNVPVIASPLASAPIYEFERLLAGVREFGEDWVVHRWLGGVSSLIPMTAETPQAFIERGVAMVRNGLKLATNLGGAIVADGNYEMCVALHVQFVEHADFARLTLLESSKLWEPRHGYIIGFRGDPDSPDVCEYDLDFNPIEP